MSMEFFPVLQHNIFEKLIIKAEQVVLKSETLSCVHTSQTINAISQMLHTVNSYYSNKIESEGTHLSFCNSWFSKSTKDM